MGMIILSMINFSNNLYYALWRNALVRNDNSCNSSKFVKSFYEDRDGIIDIQTVFSENGITSNYFISEPPVMIKSFKKFLVETNVLTSKVITDDRE